MKRWAVWRGRRSDNCRRWNLAVSCQDRSIRRSVAAGRPRGSGVVVVRRWWMDSIWLNIEHAVTHTPRWRRTHEHRQPAIQLLRKGRNWCNVRESVKRFINWLGKLSLEHILKVGLAQSEVSLSYVARCKSTDFRFILAVFQRQLP